MGKRARRRGQGGGLGTAPVSEYRDDAGGVLALRGVLSPATRREYARVRSGEGLAPGAAREDAWQRAVEFLFERLAVRWEIAGAEPLTSQKELLARFRFAAEAERRFVRDALREHLAEHFPEIEAP